MRIYKYFSNHTIPQNRRVLFILGELQFLDHYQSLIKLISQKSIDDKIYSDIKSCILNLCEIIYINQDEITDNFDALLNTFKDIYQNIGISSSDANLEGYFKNYGIESGGDEGIGLDELVLFCVKHFGIEGLEKYNLSQLFILRRYYAIKNYEIRTDFCIDNLTTSHLPVKSSDKTISKHIKQLEKLTKVSFITDEDLEDRIEDEEKDKEDLSGLSEDEIRERAVKELEELYGLKEDSNERNNQSGE